MWNFLFFFFFYSKSILRDSIKSTNGCKLLYEKLNLGKQKIHAQHYSSVKTVVCELMKYPWTKREGGKFLFLSSFVKFIKKLQILCSRFKMFTSKTPKWNLLDLEITFLNLYTASSILIKLVNTEMREESLKEEIPGIMCVSSIF